MGFIFVIGVGRSGTSLIQSMLNAHSEIYFSKETHFIKKYVAKEAKGKLVEKKSIESFKNLLYRDQNLSEFKDEIEQVVEELKSSSNSENYAAQVYARMLAIKAGNKVQYIGDKDPMNVNYLPEIKAAYPKSKIVHIIRDPRAVISSRIKSDWGKGRSLFFHCLEYEFSLHKAMKDGKDYFKESYIELRYEKLVESSKTELQNICSKLDLEFEEVMLEYYKTSKDLVRNDEIDWKSNIFEPVQKENLTKWKSDLSIDQQLKIQLLLGPTIQGLGYDLKTMHRGVCNTLELILFRSALFILKLNYG